MQPYKFRKYVSRRRIIIGGKFRGLQSAIAEDNKNEMDEEEKEEEEMDDGVGGANQSSAIERKFPRRGKVKTGVQREWREVNPPFG